jgi:hypothetical protein
LSRRGWYYISADGFWTLWNSKTKGAIICLTEKNIAFLVDILQKSGYVNYCDRLSGGRILIMQVPAAPIP